MVTVAPSNGAPQPVFTIPEMGWVNQKFNRTHHVHLFMAQEMTVPAYSHPKLVISLVSRNRESCFRVYVCEPHRGMQWQRRIQRPNAVREPKRK